MKRRVIAIVGSAPTTREMANLEPPEVEVWGMSNGYLILKRWSRWFEMHNTGKSELYEFGPPETNQRHFDFLWSCGVPVYQNRIDARIPTSVAFPVHEIGSRFRHYWACTPAYMLSLAIYEGVDEIHLWGVDLQTNTEYAKQRPCIEYWLGVAEARGVVLVIPETSALLRVPEGAYGFYDGGFSFNAAGLKDEIAGVDAQIRNAQNQGQVELLQQHIGARRTLVQMLNTADPSTIGKKIESKVIATVDNEDGRLEVLAVR